MMTEHDRVELKKVAKSMLDWKFPHPMNTEEGAKVLHHTSELLIKISSWIKQKIDEDEQSNKGDNNKVVTSTEGNR